MMNLRLSRSLALAALALSATALAGCSTLDTSAEDVPVARATATAAPTRTATPPSTPPPTTQATPTVESQLTYLIEEEKLAHDVYTTLGELWGARIFENIASSEASHQDQVAVVLPLYGIEDPRVDALGVFTDPALQSLYDDLTAEGSQSLADAIQVGITIEQTDITDLTEAIATAPADVVTVLQRLLAGSQNHLAAFERQT